MDVNNYDYVIIGAGPSGLTLAWIIANNLKKSVAVIDRESSIGGCHRVRRVGEKKYFTEHGPRIYNTSYGSTFKLLEKMDINSQDLFVPYNYNTTNLALSILKNLSYTEILALITNFIRFIIPGGETWSKKVTVLEFMQYNKFSEKSVDQIDRICRLTDGAGSDRYTLNEFYQLLNQNLFYQILQPNQANDLGLFYLWKERLLETGLVTFYLNTEVKTFIGSNDEISGVILKRGDRIMGSNFIAAVPLTNLVKILEKSHPLYQNAFGDFTSLRSYANRSKYITYIPITFHWKERFKLPLIWGSPQQDWEIAIVPLSDYIHFQNSDSKTLLSICISNTDKVSKYTGKTANQTSNRNELINEVFRQLQIVYKNILPTYQVAIISPGVYRNQNKWETKDQAFVLTTDGYFPHFQSEQFRNLYTVGPHNNKSPYTFTSMESAVNNAFALAHYLNSSLKYEYPIYFQITIKYIIYIFVLFIIIIIIYVW